ncbi:hypothetical protein JTE90_029570 [Oedothorax gibbosus]|uniref:Uncharacterized protein n=1 Tax=Oedothorax gibbosus TaxID=931172 RepID=A0AAV6VCV6_9ARAC|nr:hypothetical protein JTE90_029570 [Oedothorax gibbosus]
MTFPKNKCTNTMRPLGTVSWAPFCFLCLTAWCTLMGVCANEVSSTPEPVPCSISCDCIGPEFAIQADCSNRTLTSVPSDLTIGTVKL